MPTILVVEDDCDIAVLIQVMLELGPYSVATVNNGSAALLWLQQHKADLIVCDIRMPVLNGWDLHRTLRTDPRHVHTPVVLTSTFHGERPAVEQAGCIFLPKPFTPMALLTVVNQVLGQNHRGVAASY